EQPGNHLHVLWTGTAARQSAQSRVRPARGRRELSGHDLLAALCARRAARDHEPAAGRQREYLSDGSALEGHDAAHRHGRHRYGAIVLTRWLAHLLRVRSRWPSTSLCHGGEWWLGTAHQLQRRCLFDTGLVATR